MFSSNNLPLLRDTLLHALTGALNEQQAQQLVQLGVIIVLEQLQHDDDASIVQGAAAALAEAAAQHRDPQVREQAFAALVRQAEGGHIPAVDALYHIALEAGSLPARQVLQAQRWQPSRAELAALLQWENGALPVDQLPLLTGAFFQEASPNYQQRILREARRRGLENWAAIVSALNNLREEELRLLIERFVDFSPLERQILLDGLTERASQGQTSAQEALALLAVTHEEPSARQVAMERGYAPEDPEQRAVFLFLASDWQRYEELDFNNNLLINAYERAPRTLRRRILDHSRYTGHIEWLRNLHTESEPRWLEDLSDADWETTIERLSHENRHADLWRLAQAAPPLWSAVILVRLGQNDWQPPDGETQTGFSALLPLARAALAQPIELRPEARFRAPDKTLTTLALAQTAGLLAAGSLENELLLWKTGGDEPAARSILLPGSQVRAIALLPDASLVAAASGDHRIRILRLPEGTLVKTLEGHQALIREIVLAPGGQSLYSAGFDGSIRGWRFPTGRLLHTIQVGAGEQFALRISGDGTRLFSGGADGVLRIWALPDLTLTQEIPGHSGMLTQIAASSSGDLVATGGSDGFLRIWNAASGRLVRAITLLQPLTALALHPNETVLASGDKHGTVTLWSISTGRVLGSYRDQPSPVASLLFAGGGNFLYSAAGGVVAACDLSTFLALRQPVEYYGSHTPQPAHRPTPQAETVWLAFAGELARWRQRYDIELADSIPVSLGDFDIEL